MSKPEMFFCKTPGLFTQRAFNSSFTLRATATKPATEKVRQLHTPRIPHPPRAAISSLGSTAPRSSQTGWAQTLPHSSLRSHLFRKTEIKPHQPSAPAAPLAAGLPPSLRRLLPLPGALPCPALEPTGRGSGKHPPREPARPGCSGPPLRFH